MIASVDDSACAGVLVTVTSQANLQKHLFYAMITVYEKVKTEEDFTKLLYIFNYIVLLLCGISLTLLEDTITLVKCCNMLLCRLFLWAENSYYICPQITGNVNFPFLTLRPRSMPMFQQSIYSTTPTMPVYRVAHWMDFKQ